VILEDRESGRVSPDVARVVLASIRLANGAAALLAPVAFSRRLGVDSEANPAAPYVLRLFGVRTVLLGYELLQPDATGRRRALRTAPFVHAGDAVAGMLAGAGGRLPRRAATAATLISTANLVLALAAHRRKGGS
jgi:hypothetical protein